MSGQRVSSAVEVRGGATAEEMAAILAVLARRESSPAVSEGYRRWRETRCAALRKDALRRR
jgi:hypothetical protein